MSDERLVKQVRARHNKMQRDLICRGLLTDDLRLTDAGNAYVDWMITLMHVTAAVPAPKRRVKWKSRGRPRTASNVDQQGSTLGF